MCFLCISSVSLHFSFESCIGSGLNRTLWLTRVSWWQPQLGSEGKLIISAPYHHSHFRDRQKSITIPLSCDFARYGKTGLQLLPSPGLNAICWHVVPRFFSSQIKVSFGVCIFFASKSVKMLYLILKLISTAIKNSFFFNKYFFCY